MKSTRFLRKKKKSLILNWIGGVKESITFKNKILFMPRFYTFFSRLKFWFYSSIRNQFSGNKTTEVMWLKQKREAREGYASLRFLIASTSESLRSFLAGERITASVSSTREIDDCCLRRSVNWFATLALRIKIISSRTISSTNSLNTIHKIWQFSKL